MPTIIFRRKCIWNHLLYNAYIYFEQVYFSFRARINEQLLILFTLKCVQYFYFSQDPNSTVVKEPRLSTFHRNSLAVLFIKGSQIYTLIIMLLSNVIDKPIWFGFLLRMDARLW